MHPGLKLFLWAAGFGVFILVLLGLAIYMAPPPATGSGETRRVNDPCEEARALARYESYNAGRDIERAESAGEVMRAQQRSADAQLLEAKANQVCREEAIKRYDTKLESYRGKVGKIFSPGNSLDGCEGKVVGTYMGNILVELTKVCRTAEGRRVGDRVGVLPDDFQESSQR